PFPGSRRCSGGAAGNRIRWRGVVQTLAVFRLAQLVRVPGLRDDLPAGAVQVATWTFAAVPWQPLSIACVCLAPLIIVRALVAVSRPEHLDEAEEQRFARRGFATYLFVVLSLAMALAWELELARTPSGEPVV